MKETELKPCPKCKGQIKLYSRFGVGAVAVCQNCKEEFVICGVEELKIYSGCKIRKSTIRKVEKMWNRRADNEQRETD